MCEFSTSLITGRNTSSHVKPAQTPSSKWPSSWHITGESGCHLLKIVAIIMKYQLDILWRYLEVTRSRRIDPRHSVTQGACHLVSSSCLFQVRCVKPFLFCSCIRIYGVCCATYESASIRMFKLGRTEAIRSTSTESLRFVQAMDDKSKQVRQSMRDACDINCRTWIRNQTKQFCF